MHRRHFPVPSPALVIALVALFVALGSGAAMASGLISGKKIINHSIPERKLTAAAIHALQGQRGPAGPQGSPGPKGDTGPTGPSNAYFAHAASANVSVSVPAGDYVISAHGSFKAIITSQNASGYCYLQADGSQLTNASSLVLAYVPGPGLGEAVSPASGIAQLTAAGTLTSSCVSGINTSLGDNTITAIRVGSVSAG